MFANEAGRPLEIANVTKRSFKPAARAIGVPKLRLYDLRHTCATRFLALGLNVKVVSGRLCHASAAMTLDIYSHVLPDMQDEVTRRLGESLGGF